MIDLSEIEIVDFHMHHFSKTNISGRVKERAIDYIDYLGLTEQSSREKWIAQRYEEDLTSPYYQSLMYYVSQTYGCEPSIGEVDKFLDSRNGEIGLTQYIREVMDREQIELVQYAAFSKEPKELPADRSKWAFWVDDLVNMMWMNEEESIKSFDDLIACVERRIDLAIQEESTGLKNALGYNRSLDIQIVSYDKANRAFSELFPKRPFKSRTEKAPDSQFPTFASEAENQSFKILQDYILRRMMIKCGHHGLSFHFHTGGGLAPTDIRNCNPLLLYTLFYDREILDAGTNIVLLHGGVPFLVESSIAANSFPHVYLDLSWPIRTPIMSYALKYAIAQVSPRKILYGSDAFGLPDRLGLAASTFRKQLGSVFEEMKDYGWTNDQCLKSAQMILNSNAKRLMQLVH